ncbi:hypothetical protein AEST_17360 [Alishewanella aestuarii B11]|uniref:Uncharacterized protein n=1 Tax=Alishewanella aestuarii B11 TaxID=1197174 RepID=J2IE24_9ALTE|nr:hypothetical protein AEST_17360 [Alishewanella aestuarii B11]
MHRVLPLTKPAIIADNSTAVVPLFRRFIFVIQLNAAPAPSLAG